VRATAAPANALFRDRARTFAVEVGDRLLREQSDASAAHEPGGFADGASRGLSGHAGFAMLYAALGELTGQERFAAAMHGSLRKAALADDRPPIALFSGISGLRAAAALAVRAEPRYSKLVAQCDAFVDAQLPQRPSKGQTYGTYDLIEGWSGARLARGVAGPAAADRLVEFIVWALDDPERWRCAHPLRPADPPVHDLGLAHGVAGMLAALSLTLDPLDGPAAVAATRAMRELCDLRVDIGSHAAWPPAAPAERQTVYRSAWCYGACGVIAAIHNTASGLHDRDSAAFAEDAMHALAAQTTDSWSLEGEALCHGLMGNALCFASIASVADSADLWSVALGVADAAVDSLDANGGRCWARDLSKGYYDAVGLLDGVCGIALALLTLSGDADSSWMRLLGLRPIS
jgi:lantibiotic biosynthesis protein